MATKNHRGQCTLEFAICALALTAVLLALQTVARTELRDLARARLSGGRR